MVFDPTPIWLMVWTNQIKTPYGHESRQLPIKSHGLIANPIGGSLPGPNLTLSKQLFLFKTKLVP
jgi:hypothetical protein